MQSREQGSGMHVIVISLLQEISPPTQEFRLAYFGVLFVISNQKPFADGDGSFQLRVIEMIESKANLIKGELLF